MWKIPIDDGVVRMWEKNAIEQSVEKYNTQRNKFHFLLLFHKKSLTLKGKVKGEIDYNDIR